MRLTDLKPEWEHDNTYLVFICPTCARKEDGRGDCWIMIPVKQVEGGPKPWSWNGEKNFEKITITPSIWHHCKTDPHFFITEGEIKLV